MNFLSTLIAAILVTGNSAGPDLPQEIDEIARSAQGHAGAAIVLLETGKTISFNGTDHFPMQSVYKFPIGLAILHEVDRGMLKLDQKVHVTKADLVPPALHSPIRDQFPEGEIDLTLRELLRFMVSESDGTASDVMLRLAGGPEKVTSYLKSIGCPGIIVATSEREMAAGERVQYRNWSTPTAMAQLLSTFQRGRAVSPASTTLLLLWMTESSNPPHRIKELLPAGTIVAHKTGSSGTFHGVAAATNDAGVITLPDGRHLIVVVFVSDSTADEAAREATIARIAQAAWIWATASH